MATTTRVFVGRLAQLSVFDPLGEKLGRVRDVVVTFSTQRTRPRVIGLVIEVGSRKRIFVPMTRVISVEGGQVLTTGLVNVRRFEQRANETLVLAELVERHVQVKVGGEFVDAIIEDIGLEQAANRGWSVTRAFVRKRTGGSLNPFSSRRRGETFVTPIEDVLDLREVKAAQSAARLLETYQDMKPADLAEVIHDLAPKRRAEVAAALDDDRLADVIEELPADDQIEILVGLQVERAADVLEAMEPDDAADLLSELPPERQEELLEKMDQDEAEDVRRLLTYDDDTAGGLMTTEPVIMGPEASIAEALALVRREELATALATTVFVCRPPLETPTGRYLGMVHIQRLLREPPHAPIGGILDKDVEPLTPDASLGQITRMLANYNMVGLPVVDDESGALLGAVTVDDVLDHILPEDWREDRHEPDQEHPEVAHG